MNGLCKQIVSGLLLLAAVLLLAGCGQGDEGQPTATPTPAAADAAGETAADDQATATPLPARGTTVLAEGALAAENPPLPLSFTTSGRLLQLHVQAGDQVEAGQLIATLDEKDLLDARADAGLAVRQAQNSLDQAQLALDTLLNWEADETAVAQAEANLAAAEASLANAQTQDSVSGYSVTAARVQLEQAQEALANAQEAYETAFDPGREWELYIDDPSCRTGEQFPNCTGPPYSDVIEAERDAAERAVPAAEDQLRVAEANYRLALAGVNDDSAVSAEASIAAARQALAQARQGPQPDEIAAARLQVEQAQIALEQAQMNAVQADEALADTRLHAPWAGTILSVDSAPGAFTGAGTAVVTLLDTERLLFETNNLSERDLAQISPGQAAIITLKAFPSEALSGHVQRVAPRAAGTIGDAATFTVVIALDESELALLPGMTGRVEISS